MSKTIDQRVVEMQFDNRQFERNVATTMSTLDKLKQKLNLSGAVKGLDEVDHAAKKVNFSVLDKSIETVRVKFSALQLAGITAFTNLTNSAINAGKNIVNALTIDPVKTGFSEYELKMGSIQTIMASTGESLATVNQYLEELNAYSDQTIYSFSDMTQNIGKFTNAGVKLEDAVAAIKGISNEAALSGANANEASRAMYNFAQALSAGYVKLIDWKSIENANMATVGFKEELIKTAVEMKKLTKTTDGYKTSAGTVITATKNFNESLQDEWMTSEVLITTLKRYADENTELGEKASAAATEVKTFTQMLDTLKESAQSGWAKTWEILFGDFEEGKALWTSLGETIGGVIDAMNNTRNNFLEKFMGSTSTWDKLAKKIKEIGSSTEDFEESIKETIGEDKFDEIIKDAGSFESAIKRGKFATDDLEKAISKLIKTSDGLETDKLGGRTLWWGHVGEDVEQVQKILDALDYNLGETGVDGRIGRYTSDAIKQFQKEHGLLATGAVNGETVAALKEAAAAINETTSAVEDLKKEWSQLLDGLEDNGGRALLVESFELISKQLEKPIQAIKNAWNAVFGEDPLIDSEKIYSLIEKIHDLAESFEISEEACTNFEKIATGAFAMLDLSAWIAKTSLSTFVKVIGEILKVFDTDILTVVAKLADKLVVIRDWFKDNTIFIGMGGKLVTVLTTIAIGIHNVIDAIWKLEKVQELVENFKTMIKDLFGVPEGADTTWLETFIGDLSAGFDKLIEWIKGIDKTEDIGAYIIEGIKNGLVGKAQEVITKIIEIAKQLISSFALTIGCASPAKAFISLGSFIILGLVKGLGFGIAKVVGTIVALAALIIVTFCKILGIASPSKVFMALGAFIIFGLAKGLTDGVPELLNTIKEMGQGIIDVITDILENGLPYTVEMVKTVGSKLLDAFKSWEVDFGALVVVGTIIGLFLALRTLLKLLDKIVSPLGAMKGVFESLKEGIDGYFKAKKVEVWADAIRNLAISIALLSAAFIALAQLKPAQLITGAIAIVVIAGSLKWLATAASKLGNVELGKLAYFMLGFAASVFILAKAMDMLSDISWDRGLISLGMVLLLAAGMAAVIKTFGKHIQNPEVAANMSKAGWMFIQMAAAIFMMAAAIKMIANIPVPDLLKGGLVIVAMFAMFKSLTKAGSTAKFADGTGLMLLKMAGSIMILAIAIKVLAAITPGDITKGMITIALITVLFKSIIKASTIAGEGAGHAGTMFLKMGAAIGMLAIAMKILASLSYEDVIKGILVVGALETMFWAFLKFSKQGFGDASKQSGALFIGMAAGMALMAVAIKIIAGIKGEDILKGIATLAALEAMLVVISKVSETAGIWSKENGQMFFKMALAILVLAGAIALLSILDERKVMVGTGAIMMLMAMFALIVAASSEIKSCQKTLTLIAVNIGLLVGAIALLAYIGDKDMKNIITATECIGAILVMFAVLLVASKFAGKVSASVLWMVAAVAGIAIVLGVLASFELKNTLENALALSAVLLAMAAVTGILAVIGPAAAGVLPGLEALLLVISGLGIFMLALGALTTNKNIEHMTRATELIGEIGNCIGKFFGEIIEGFMEGAIGDLPEIGKAIGEFAENAAIDATTVDGLRALADFMVGLTAYSFSGAPIAEFTQYLPALGESLGTFSSTLDKFNIEESDVEKMKLVGEIVGVLAKASDDIDGQSFIGKGLFGDNSLDVFLDNLPTIAYKIKTAALMFKSFESADISKLKDAFEIIGVLTKAGADIDGQSQMGKDLFGDNSIGTFLQDIGKISRNIKQSVQMFRDVEPDDIKNTKLAFDIIKTLVDAGANITPSGGKWAELFGDSSLVTFASGFGDIASSIKAFITNVGEFTQADVDTVKFAGAAITELANATKSIEGQGGINDIWDGITDVAGFGESLPQLGADLSAFVGNLGTFGESQVTSIKAVTQAIRALTALGEIDMVDVIQYLPSLGDTILTFSQDMVDFCLNISSINMDQAGQIASSFVGTINMLESELSGSKDNIESIGLDLTGALTKGLSDNTSGIDGAVSDITKAITSGISDAAGDVTSAGMELIDALDKGLTDKVKLTNIDASGKAAGAKAKDGMRNKYRDAESAGKYLIDGLVKGLQNRDKKNLVWAAGVALGQWAVDAIKNGGLIASPSKATIEAGEWMGEGLVIGMNNLRDKVYNAGYGVGEYAANSMSDAVRSISSIIDSDIDTQPTIRPIMDLTDIRNGANSINGMLDMNPSVGVMTNVRAINSMMSRNGQNGANSDVISAINDLGKTLGGASGDTYYINGVNVGDDPEVVDAFKTITKAIIRGRRS